MEALADPLKLCDLVTVGQIHTAIREHRSGTNLASIHRAIHRLGIQPIVRHTINFYAPEAITLILAGMRRQNTAMQESNGH